MSLEFTRLSLLSHSLEGSPILAYSNAVKSLQASGKQVYNYTVGDFDPCLFPIPTELKYEIIKAITEDHTNYPAAEGNKDLRMAIAGFEKEFHELHYTPDEVLVGSGGRPLIYAAFRTICDKGDKVLYALPNWNTAYYTQLVEATGVEIETGPSNGFLPTAASLQPHVKEAVLLCLCSPQNPTGTVFSNEELFAISSMVVKENQSRPAGQKKLYLLFDAMYGGLTAKEQSHVDPVSLCPAIKPYVIYINAISKIFAATGLRLGWALGPVAIMQKMKIVLSHMGAWAPMAEQKAVARYLVQSGPVKKYLKSFKSELDKRLLAIHSGLMELKKEGFPVDAIMPGGGIYLSVKIDLIGRQFNRKQFCNAADIAAYLLDQSGFALLPFSAFGASPLQPWFRISVGTCKKEEIPSLLHHLRLALLQLKTESIKNQKPVNAAYVAG